MSETINSTQQQTAFEEGVFAGLVSKTVTVGAPVAHPSGSYVPSPERTLADAFKPKI